MTGRNFKLISIEKESIWYSTPFHTCTTPTIESALMGASHFREQSGRIRKILWREISPNFKSCLSVQAVARPSRVNARALPTTLQLSSLIRSLIEIF